MASDAYGNVASATVHQLPGTERKDGGEPPDDGTLGSRVTKLESDMNDVRVMLARIEERTASMVSHMATKADIEALRADLTGQIGNVETSLSGRLGNVEGSLDGKLGYWQFVGTGIALAALILAVLRLPQIISLLQ